MTAEVVDPATGEVVVLDQAAAKKRAGFIRGSLDNTWTLIVEAYNARDWLALGYATWDAYCAGEFRGKRLAVPRQDRGAVVSSLRDAGMSLPAISAATGLGYGTVHREATATYPDGQVDKPAPITGVNGKTYAPTRPEPADPARHLQPVPEPRSPSPAFTDRRTVNTQLLDRICRLAEPPTTRQQEHAAAWAGQIDTDETTLARLDAAITYLSLLREELAR